MFRDHKNPKQKLYATGKVSDDRQNVLQRDKIFEGKHLAYIQAKPPVLGTGREHGRATEICSVTEREEATLLGSTLSI